MALNDKNIIITPNIGSTSDPKIEFRGADASTGPSTITATVYPTNGGTLSFQATEGTLFSISNSLSSGSIFSVNPISGIPIIDVNANRTIALNPFGGNTGVGTANPSQKLHVQGNLRLTGALYDVNNLAGTNGQVLKSTGAGVTWVTGSGSGIDADLLDGLDSSQFLRSDTNDDAAGLYTFSNTSGSPKLAMTGHAGAANFNYFLNASNDTGIKAVHFVNGSTRSADNGANAYVIRNDGGPFVLGRTEQTTTIQGSTVTTPSQIVSTLANNAATGGGQIYLNGATGNRIDFVGGGIGVGAPTLTTRSVGTKIVLYPSGNLATDVDYAFGIDSSTLWSSIPTTSSQFKWYGGTTLAAYLTGAGVFYATGSFRAPQFIDSDNTAFYVDAGATSILSAITVSGNLSAWNTTTPGTGIGGLHLGAASATTNVGPAITFGARDASSGGNAQAGIYINSDGNYGTRMYFATTDSYAVGSKVAMSISESGAVSLTRGGLTASGIIQGTVFTSTRANDATTGGGQINLNGATGNRIDFNTNGTAAPSFTTRSVGTKIVLFPELGASNVDYAFGIEGGTLWSSVPLATNARQFRWYGGTTQLMDLKGSGELTIGSASLTGTASQKLQVTGGGYVSGNLGVGATNPLGLLHVEGVTGSVPARITGAVSNSSTVAFYNNAATTNRFIVGQGYFTGTDNIAFVQNDANAALVFGTNLSEKVRIRADGTFEVKGAGTAGSTPAFSVSASASGNTAIIDSNSRLLLGTTTSYTKLTVSNGLSTRTGITLSDANTASLMLFAGASQGAVITTDSVYQDLIFKRGSNAGTESGTETMRIDGSGRLGIGTNSPLQRLHVQGNLLVAAGSATGQHITQKPYELNGGTLSWEGSAGQLFSITNNLTSGSIFSVNDVSGIPSIDVDANGIIELAPYGGSVGVGTINPTSKLHVVGDTLVTGTVTASRFVSTVATGTAPFTVASTTLVTNLNADLLDGYNTSTAGNANTIALRDGSGHLSMNYGFAAYFNSSDDVNTGTLTYLMGKFGDNYFRSATAAKVATFISGQTMNITGSSSLNVLKAGDTMTGQLISTLANNAATGGGQIYLNGANGNRIDFVGGGVGVAAPTFTTRSVGTKIVLYPELTSSLVDYALGIESATLWSSIPGSGYAFKWYAGTSNIATLFASGTFSATGDFRAPIFYDSGATAYYLDPGNTGISLNVAGAALATYFRDNTGSYNVNLGSGGTEGRGLVAGYSGGSYGGIGYNVRHTATGATWIAPSNDTSSYLLFNSGGFTFYGEGGGTAGRTLSYTGIASLTLGGVFTTSGSFRAPQFIDSDNPAFYADPSGTSLLNATRHNSINVGTQSALSSNGQLGIYSTGSPFISFHDNTTARTAYFQELSGRFYCGEVTYTESEGSFRAPLFYDVNNTAYYLDPASTSVTNAQNIANLYDASITRFVSPNGGFYTTNTATVTGAIRIRLPANRRNSATMLRFTVKIYEYNTGYSTEFQIGGYNYSLGGWINVFATQLTDAGRGAFTVRFGDDTTRDFITIGEVSTTWSYPQVFITDVQCGYGGQAEAWGSDWLIDFVTTLPTTVETTRTASLVKTTNNASSWAYADYATTYYNQNDTNSYWTANDLVLRGSSPTITFRDTNHNTAYLHCNDNLFYILRGGNDLGTGGWSQVDGAWPLYINLTSNDATFGRTVSSIAYVNNFHFYSNWRITGSGVAASNAYNNIMGADNDTGNKLAFFLNSSTRTADGGANGLTFRNDGGPLNLGSSSYTTNILGSQVRVGAPPYAGTSGVYDDTRMTMAVGGTGLNSIVYQSQYNSSAYPDYGLVFIHGAAGGNRNVWSISPDGPARGDKLGFLYDINSTNIHVGTYRFWLDGSGNSYSQTSSRAPIFYDSDATAYYLDPGNSGTSLNVLGNIVINSNVGAGGATALASMTGRLVFDNDYSDAARGPNKIQLLNDASAWVAGFGVHAGTVSYYSGDTHKWYKSNSVTSFTEVMTLNNAGYLVAANAVASPIFYDSANTAYYLNPNGTSALSIVNIEDGNVELYKSFTVDMSNTAVYSTSNYYPVTIPINTEPVTIFISNNLNSNVPSWGTHPSGFSLNLRWVTNGSGWGTTPVKRKVQQWSEQWASSRICGGITQMTTASTEVVYLRGGGIYYFRLSRNFAPVPRSATYTANTDSVSPTATAVNEVWNSATGAEEYYVNNIYSDTSVRAPIYYDSNNTNFYADLNNTGTSINAAGSIASEGAFRAESSDSTQRFDIYYNEAADSLDFDYLTA